MYFLEAKVPSIIYLYEENHFCSSVGPALQIPQSCHTTAWQPLACSDFAQPLKKLQEKYSEVSVVTRIVEEADR